ncbi:protein-glutamate O-methyltransferase CheR [Aliikangiella sp. G2MR2-5]|uniref:CheR family methyltransferase n=1 Tax=Aliikangiella sp. G2MR2-5 TaxID=2788943 RepID=UPI0018A9E27D|nr:protein-glutamate O-methyltransferase CheR [Aliikangiella sp. G2MR2-5]
MAAYELPEMESEEFALWQTLLEKRTGLWLPESRKVFLIAALTRHLKDKGLKNFSELYSKLDAGAITVLDWATLVDSLTVHETCYYRDSASLNLVANYCRNRAIEGFQSEPNKPQHIQLWSVGCSTGEEAYTLAIELDKVNHGLRESQGKDIYYGVTAIDISYPSLAVAREGIYAARQLDFVPQAAKNLYFDLLADDYYQVKEPIRQRTCFIQGNVLELGERNKQLFDVIYCQNVLIYFRSERKKMVVNQLTKRLKPGGLLVLGHGEVTLFENGELTRLDNKDCLAYLKKSNDNC